MRWLTRFWYRRTLRWALDYGHQKASGDRCRLGDVNRIRQEWM